jgi:hypothetical protein
MNHRRRTLCQCRDRNGMRSQLVADLRAETEALLEDIDVPPRPRTRGDCVHGPRPCPHVSCRYHLGLDVLSGGGLSLPLCEPWDLTETCALDVADRGTHTLQEIAKLLGYSRNRIRQVAEVAVMKMARVLVGNGK